MKRLGKSTLLFCLGLAWTLAAPAAAPAQETAGQTLARLEKLAPEKRQAALVEGAKAEREVTFYSSLQAQQLDPFARAFNKRYPFLKVNLYRVSGNKQLIKIQTEYAAGKPLVDVINGSGEDVAVMKNRRHPGNRQTNKPSGSKATELLDKRVKDFYTLK